MSLLEQQLREQVQHNCHIVDARHGADFGMCTYLMKMREYYRWEQGLALGASLPRDEIGDWLSEREALWEQSAEQDYAELRIGDHTFDPFDAEAINARIKGQGLVYSAGLIHGAKPNFFLAELESHEQPLDGFEVWLSGRELARGLNTPPAMLRGRSIFLRRESLRLYLFEKYETWRWHSPDNAFARALACYPFDTDLEAALEQMTGNELAAAREHEVGEFLAGERLGEAWNELLLDLALTPAELMARAVRDHLADCARTLPMLLETGRAASIHFFAGNLTAMRKQLFPALEAAYVVWRESGNDGELREMARRGAEHWLAVAERLLELHQEHGDQVAAPAQTLIESRIL